MTRIHDSYYDPEQKKWIRRKAKVNGLDIKLAKSIPYIHVSYVIPLGNNHHGHSVIDYPPQFWEVVSLRPYNILQVIHTVNLA